MFKKHLNSTVCEDPISWWSLWETLLVWPFGPPPHLNVLNIQHLFVCTWQWKKYSLLLEIAIKGNGFCDFCLNPLSALAALASKHGNKFMPCVLQTLQTLWLGLGWERLHLLALNFFSLFLYLLPQPHSDLLWDVVLAIGLCSFYQARYKETSFMCWRVSLPKHIFISWWDLCAVNQN